MELKFPSEITPIQNSLLEFGFYVKLQASIISLWNCFHFENSLFGLRILERMSTPLLFPFEMASIPKTPFLEFIFQSEPLCLWKLFPKWFIPIDSLWYTTFYRVKLWTWDRIFACFLTKKMQKIMFFNFNLFKPISPLGISPWLKQKTFRELHYLCTHIF